MYRSRSANDAVHGHGHGHDENEKESKLPIGGPIQLIEAAYGIPSKQ